MSDDVFVDTNVLVYARDTRDAAKQARAQSWLERLWRERRGRTSMQVLNEYYVVTTRKLSPGLPREDAWADVQALMAWRPVVTNGALLTTGRTLEREYDLAWWDALVIAAAETANCRTLLSEDFQNGRRFHSVQVCNPFAPDRGDPAPRP